MTAKQIFTRIVKGRNMFTPYLVAYYKIKNGAVELSTSVSFHEMLGLTESGFMEGVYGVTVVRFGERSSKENKLFHSEKEAIDYVMTLKPSEKTFYVRSNSYGDIKEETVTI